MNEKKLKHVTFDKVFLPLDILMATMGVIKLYQPGNIRNKFQIFQWILCVICASNLAFVLVGILSFVFTSESSYDLLEAMPNIFIGSIAFTKITTLLVRRKLIYEITNDLKYFWPRVEDENGIKRLYEFLTPTNKLCFLNFVVTIGTAFTFSITPIVSTFIQYIRFGECHLYLPFLVWYPFEYENSLPRFVGVFVSQLWSGFSVANFMMIGDTFLCLVISLLCYQFEIICDSLKAIQPNPSNPGDYYSVTKNANYSLKRCILHHSRLLRICQLIEDIFSFAMFVNFAVSSVIICEILFDIMVVSPDKISTYLLYITSITVQNFMLCWHSDLLMSQSTRLASVAYLSGWYYADKEFKMNIIMLQMRAQKPVSLTAMKFATLSINTFLNIMASAWSYFTLLRQLYAR